MMRRPMPDLDGVKSAIARAVDALRPELERVALALHGEPELAYEEHRSAERLASLLSSCGLSVARPYSGIATSFLAADAAMMFHAGTADEIDPLMLAMVSLEVEFTGKAAHAAARPYLGVNALDAMVMAYNNVSALRQVIRSDSRVHGIITHGGDAPNIIPARTAGRFMVRSPDNRYLEQLKQKVQRCFESASLATGTQVRLTWVDQCDTLTTNDPIAEAFAANAAALGRPMRRRNPSDTHGSTDMGNVSSQVPSIHPYLAIAPQGTPTHSLEFARYAATPEALDTMVVAAKALAMTAADLLSSPDLLRRAKHAHAAN